MILLLVSNVMGGIVEAREVIVSSLLDMDGGRSYDTILHNA
ncbi:hypothetical protein GBAR_LOCUS23554 [Geodia barretti]|uniref:Uncharacterized protein n=1 Tax=Geodia barretti TaxID=519541 RepID=A0AA35T7S6_GEOBA|nr:hypothetical protein GBAR_LOCUS23554 [Geodia barretti]